MAQMVIIKFLPVFFLPVLLSPVRVQAQLPGKYIFYSAVGEKLKSIPKITLNCDNTFLAEDSSFSLVAMGTWRIRKKKLVLHTDSAIVNSKTTKNGMTTKYSIKEEGLQTKVMTKRQYKKMIRKWNRQMPEPAYFQDYEKMKELQENRFYKKIDPFNCL